LKHLSLKPNREKHLSLPQLEEQKHNTIPKVPKHAFPYLLLEDKQPSNIMDIELEINRLQQELEERKKIKNRLIVMDLREHTAKLEKQLSIGEQFEGQITSLLVAVDEIRGFMKVLGANAVLEREVLEKLNRVLRQM